MAFRDGLSAVAPPPWQSTKAAAGLSPSAALSSESLFSNDVVDGAVINETYMAEGMFIPKQNSSGLLEAEFWYDLIGGRGLRFLPQYNGWVDTRTLAVLSVGYLACIWMLKRVMADRAAMQLKAVMRVYNVVQVVLCSYMAIGLLVSPLLNAPKLPAAFMGVRMPNIFGLTSEYSAHAEWFILVHYMSKFLDLLDTVFIILRKKDDQLSFLHIYHHATIGVMWGIVLRTGHGSGTAAYGAFINSVIHVLMYSHYFITSFGINNPFKKYLTAAQICQFYSCVTHALLVAGFIYLGWETSIPKQLAGLQLSYHFSMITLFSAFYRRKFSARKQNKQIKDA